MHATNWYVQSALGSGQGEVIVAKLLINKVPFKREYFIQITIIQTNLEYSTILFA